MDIFTFWEGEMPEYVKLCMDTWKFNFTVLNFDNICNYTDLKVTNNLKSFSLPQISDAVRAHILRDHVDSYWLDADTIMLTDKLPAENVIGDPVKRTHSTGVSHSTGESMGFFRAWASYQDRTIADKNHPNHWSVLVNMFTDTYVPNHLEVKIYDITKCRPELLMVEFGTSSKKYKEFYFDKSYHLSDLPETDFLVLHNSWTPKWYKGLSKQEILNQNCTMSNILREVNRV